MDYFDIREDTHKEIHSFKASWFLKWGVTVVFIIIGIIIWLSAIVRYPDIITGEAILTSSNPPATLLAVSTAQIKHIHVIDNAIVKKGDYLLEYEHAADLRDIKKLKKLLSGFTTDRDSLLGIYKVLNGHRFQLGEIQNSYYEFIKVLYSHYYFFELRHDILKINELREQKKIQQKLSKHYQNIQQIKRKEFQLVESREKTDSSLLQENIINEFSYKTSLINTLSKQNNIENANISFSGTLLQLNKIKESITNLKLDREEKISQLSISIPYAYNNLKSTIHLWEQKYTVKAAINGKVAFLSYVKEKNTVSAGDRLFTILPPKIEYEVQLKFPFEGAEKVKTKQNVRIKLSDVPYKEFGYLPCTIKKIAQVANEDHYLAVAIPKDELVTTFDKQISYKENMKGIGEIVTNDRSLLGRMLEKILYVFEN